MVSTVMRMPCGGFFFADGVAECPNLVGGGLGALDLGHDFARVLDGLAQEVAFPLYPAIAYL
ncbi:MAG: hypothetical protein M2R45_05243 [Verrucomicrobia subdivision 3 bacterium]|nr:hypothetical protein [Limisphaerales bacterium]